MKHLGDVSKINGAAIEKVDVITFGAPCQDLSVAGKRKGMKHEANGDDETTRSGLFYEAIRIIKEMRESDDDGRTREFIRPRYAIYENVPGAFSSNQGKDFQAVLTEIVRIAEPNAPDVPLPEGGKWPKSGALCDELAGWSVAWKTHDAQYHGVPQRRRRVCVLADFNGITAGDILFDPQLRRKAYSSQSDQTFRDTGRQAKSKVQPLCESMLGDSEQGQSEGEGTSEGTEDCSGEPGVKVLNPSDSQGNQVADDDGVYPTLRGCGGAGYQQGYAFQHALSFQERAGKPGGGKGILIQDEHVGSMTSQNVQSVFAYGIDQQGGKGNANYTEDVAPTILSDSHGTPHGVAYATQACGDRDNASQSYREETAYSLPANPMSDRGQVVIYGISPFCSNAMMSDNPHSGIYKAETSRTLDLNGGSPACNQGGLAVVTVTKQMGMTDDDTASTIVATEYKEPQAVFCLEGNGQRESHRGDGWKESDVSYTLNTTEQHGVYACDVYNQTIEGDIAPTVTAAAGGTNTSGPKILEQRKEENENV